MFIFKQLSLPCFGCLSFVLVIRNRLREYLKICQFNTTEGWSYVSCDQCHAPFVLRTFEFSCGFWSCWENPNKDIRSCWQKSRKNWGIAENFFFNLKLTVLASQQSSLVLSQWKCSVLPEKQKFKCWQLLARAWHLSGSLFWNNYDFTK